MKLIRDLNHIPESCRGAVVALGNFDGVHLGHQAIIRHAIATAKANGGAAAVMTFEPHPREFFARQRCHPERSEGSPALAQDPSAALRYAQNDKALRLYSFRDKVALLEEAGIDALFVMRFNHALASLSAEDFVGNVLHDALQMHHVVTGSNFAFGKNRQGNTAFLDTMAAKLSIGYSACVPVHDVLGQPVSSSAIRAALATGDVAKAANLLGRTYAISGRVQRGEQRGRTLGFPTANVSLKGLWKPRFGVYAVRVKMAGSEQWLPGVASIGVKPTFGVHEPLLEAYLFDRNENLYGKRLTVELVEFIRDEVRFDDVEALKRQMADDSRIAKDRLKRG